MVTSAQHGVSEIGSELLSLQGSRQAKEPRKEAVSRDLATADNWENMSLNPDRKYDQDRTVYQARLLYSFKWWSHVHTKQRVI